MTATAPHTTDALAGIAVGVLKDDRSVKLTRTGATNEWHTLVGGVPVTHGDTIYSFTEHQGLQNPEWVPMPQKFKSTLSGDNWATGFYPDSGNYNITWDWVVPNGLEEYSNLLLTQTPRQTAASSYKAWNQMSRVTEKGELELWYGALGNTAPSYTDEATPKRGGRPAKTVKVKYFARDNVDQAEAEAHYDLTVHEPVEIVSNVKKPVQPIPVVFPLFVKGTDGVAKFLGIYTEDAEHPAAEGTITRVTGAAQATTLGFSVGQQGGVDLHIIPDILSLNSSRTLEFNWSKTYETSTEIGAELTLPLPPNHGAYLAGKWLYQRYETKYRWFEASGEKRSPGSPALPNPSTPWVQIWDDRLNDEPTVYWKKVDFATQSLPDKPTVDNPVYRPSAPEL